MVHLDIGSGECDLSDGSGYFNTINWGKNEPYFIKTETSIGGYPIESTAELLRVPYALFAKDAATVNGKRVLTEVPEGAVFTDNQTAKEIEIDPIANLSATHVQEALEELHAGIVVAGDMKTRYYDTNQDDLVDNAATVDNLTVQTSVPAKALFTDTQKASEVYLATAIDIDGDNINETTVEEALVTIYEQIKRLKKVKAIRDDLGDEAWVENRLCVATRYDEHHDLVSFINGTERALEKEEKYKTYCHYIYGQKSFVANSYKVI